MMNFHQMVRIYHNDNFITMLNFHQKIFITMINAFKCIQKDSCLDDLDLKCRVVSLDKYTLKIFSDLNSIGHGGLLTIFYPLDIWASTFQA